MAQPIKHLAVMGAVVLLLSTVFTPDARAELERLVGNTGETIGYLDRQGERTFVKDRCFQTMGYVTSKGTFTDTGIRKAQSPLPSLLLESKRNCARRAGGRGE